MKSIEYIDAIKARYGWSDYRVAQELKVTRSAISKHRRGENTVFSDEVSITVGELLDIDPIVVIAEMNSVKAKSSKERDFWKSLSNVSACLVLCLFIALPSPNAEAKAFDGGSTDLTPYRLCALRLATWIGRLWRIISVQVFRLLYPTVSIA